MKTPLRLSDLRSWLSHTYPPRVVALWSAISLLVALAGPFGTYAELALPARVAYWVGIFGLAIFVAQICRRVFRRWLRPLPVWRRGVVVSTVFATAFAPLVHLLHNSAVVDAPIHQVPLATLWMVVFLSSVVESALWIVSRQGAQPRPGTEPVADPAPVPAAETPRLLSRLDPDLKGELQSLSGRDHYVDVTTDRGRGSLLLRFADALDELGGVEGLRVHRSHWVARAAMERIERETGRIFLRLKDSRLIPVSRSYRDEVLALGLPAMERSGTALGGVPSSTARAPSPISAKSAASVQESPPV